MPRPIELIPARTQSLCGWPAVLNFGLGGLGAGFYAVSVLAAGLGQSLAVSIASWLGPLLVLAALAAVATEAGRPLRGARVLARFRTSWMSRELWLGGLFVLFVATDLAFPLPVHRALSALAALVFALAQGFIVRQARGVTAWDVPLMPLMFLLSALISGTGLYLVIEVIGGQRPGGLPLFGVLILLTTGLIVWARYLWWSSEPAFVCAVAPLAHGRDARLIVGAGYVAPLLLMALASLIPAIAGLALLPAGVLVVVVQFYTKARLILAAGQLRPITLAGLRVPKRVLERRAS
jgi:DMSO reductase anchor subunit